MKARIALLAVLASVALAVIPAAGANACGGSLIVTC